MSSSHSQGTMWRSATTNQPIQGYSKAVLDSMKNSKGLPPKEPVKDLDQNSKNPFVTGIIPTKEPAAEKKASLNLQTAIQKQNAPAQAFPEVDGFLESINLQKYQDRFIENGIEDLETILELNDSHLDAIGIPLGYKLKIIKRIKTIRQEKGMTVPQSRQG